MTPQTKTLKPTTATYNKFKVCPSCQDEIYHDAKICPFCKHEQTITKKQKNYNLIECKSCDQLIFKGANKCPHCNQIDPTTYPSYGVSDQAHQYAIKKLKKQSDYLNFKTFKSQYSGEVKKLIELSYSPNHSERYYSRLINRINTMMKFNELRDFKPVFLTITLDGFFRSFKHGNYKKWNDYFLIDPTLFIYSPDRKRLHYFTNHKRSMRIDLSYTKSFLKTAIFWDSPSLKVYPLREKYKQFIPNSEDRGMVYDKIQYNANNPATINQQTFTGKIINGNYEQSKYEDKKRYPKLSPNDLYKILNYQFYNWCRSSTIQRLQKEDIHLTFIKAIEPHKDGVPHMHILYFVPK
ncbi:MAG: hypothetical protein U9N49_07940, partial [Campylobacterota bacterium]|nr:hypothetical protein [Campylobacterota bacterium]